VPLRGSRTWQTAAFHVRNAGFHNAQNGGSDFRLKIEAPVLHVRRVTLTRETNQAMFFPEPGRVFALPAPYTGTNAAPSLQPARR
jgi:hypothetical protein